MLLSVLYSGLGKVKQGPVMKELGLGDDALADDLGGDGEGQFYCLSAV